MEALLQSLAAKYGFDYAVKLLGLDQQTQNPKYAISVGGQTLDVGNMAKRGMLNQGIKALTGASKMGMAVPLIAGGLGLAYLRNPLRKGSMNYNPYLKDQMTYLSGNNMLGTDQSGLTKYGPDSVLSGQNVVSLFGTNDYRGQLGKKQSYFEDRINNRKNYSQTQYEKTLNEIKEYEKDQANKELAKEKKAADIKAKNTMTSNQSYNGGGGGGSGTNNAQHGSSGMSKSQHSAFRAARGGIASL